MFGTRFRSTIGPVGVAITPEVIRLIQVRHVAGALHVVGAAEIDLDTSTTSFTGATSADGIADETGDSGDGSAEGAAGGADAGSADGGAAGAAADAGDIALADRLRAAMTTGRFTGRQCVVALPREDIHLQSLRLPSMPDGDLREAASWEVAQRLGKDRSEIQIDFIRTGARSTATGAAAATGGSETREELLIAAADHATLARRLSPLLIAGLRPVAVDLSFTAIARTLSRHLRRAADLNVVRAVLDIEPSGSMLMILRGDQVAFAKQLAVGGRQFDQAVADHLQMDIAAAHQLRMAHSRADAPASGGGGQGDTRRQHDSQTERAIFDAVRPLFNDLIKEVTLCLRYFGVTFRGHPPDRLILTGSASHEPRFSETLSRACSIEVGYDDGPSGMQGTLTALEPDIRQAIRRPDASVSAWVAPIGLSVRGIGAKRSMLKHVTSPSSAQHPIEDETTEQAA